MMLNGSSNQSFKTKSPKYTVFMHSSRIEKDVFNPNSTLTNQFDRDFRSVFDEKVSKGDGRRPVKPDERSGAFGDFLNQGTSYNDYTIRTIDSGNINRLQGSWNELDMDTMNFSASSVKKNLKFSRPNSTMKGPHTRSTVTIKPIEVSKQHELEAFNTRFDNYQKSLSHAKNFKKCLNLSKRQSKDYLKISKKAGYGTEIWDDGSKYQGFWKDGKKNGKGLFFWVDGSSYCGNFKDDLLSGFGKLCY